jgi:hypothetical protein
LEGSDKAEAPVFVKYIYALFLFLLIFSLEYFYLSLTRVSGDTESNLVRKLRCLDLCKVVLRNQVGLEAETTNKCQWTQVTLGVNGLTMSKHMLAQIPRSRKSLGTDWTLCVLRRMS